MSIGPLTTTFAPPSSCLAADNVWKVHTTCPGNDGCYYLLQGPPTTSACFPPNYRFESTAYYSPGICPSGYTPACSSSATVSGRMETQHTCCPTVHDFTCVGARITMNLPFLASFGCASAFTDSGVLTVTDLDRFSTAITTEAYGDNGAINAFAVQVRFQATDFVSTTSSASSSQSTNATPASSPSGSNASPTGTPSPSSTNPAANNQGSNTGSSSSGLSTGAKAGIGVGAALGALAVLALLFFLYKRGKRNPHAAGGSVEQYPPTGTVGGYGPVHAQEAKPLGTYYGAETYAHNAGGSPAGSPPAGAYYPAGEQSAVRHELPGQERKVHEMQSA